jgi:cytochrome c peroxidase
LEVIAPMRHSTFPASVAISVIAEGIRVLLCVLMLTPLALAAAAEEPAREPVGDVILPVPLSVDLDTDEVRLGERLFNDARLSHNNRLSCASCHQLDAGGDDGQARTLGSDGQPLDFNVPTIFNAALSFRLNWRGNFRTFEELTEKVLLDSRLMATTWQELLSKLRADQAYEEAFHATYGGPPSPPLVLDALAAFQRSLTTPGAPFDRYLQGARHAISPDEERGYQLFRSIGCASCHQGVNVGGNLFQRFGVFHDPFPYRPTTNADLGRFALTGKKEDRFVFRVPSLRNVAVTAPYFHDGSAATLGQAVREMGRVQLGRTLSSQEVGLIVQFLRTLTGEYRRPSIANQSDGRP